MKRDYSHVQSIYWVFTQLCNDQCDHCYNSSGPQGNKMSLEECFQVIDNLPPRVDRIILSGGEPLAEREKLYKILDRLHEKYNGATQIMLQTNGDLLTASRLKKLIEKGVSRFDIASIDRYHKAQGQRLMELSALFESQGLSGEEQDPLIKKENYLHQHGLSWGFWGATEDMWLGGNWARGRAKEKDIWKKNPTHNFCEILSGGIGFLEETGEIPQEISIQLWAINPCCPGTQKAMGDARKDLIEDVLLQATKSAVFRSINQGDPLGMGISQGISREYALLRTNELQNVCLWCDEFFEHHYDIRELLTSEEEKN